MRSMDGTCRTLQKLKNILHSVARRAEDAAPCLGLPLPQMFSRLSLRIPYIIPYLIFKEFLKNRLKIWRGVRVYFMKIQLHSDNQFSSQSYSRNKKLTTFLMEKSMIKKIVYIPCVVSKSKIALWLQSEHACWRVTFPIPT